MKAPYKIYVPQHNIEAGTIQELGELAVEGSVEYIRKDALLKWANAKKTELLEMEITDVSAGLNGAYDLLIDKLKSM